MPQDRFHIDAYENAGYNEFKTHFDGPDDKENLLIKPWQSVL